MKRLLILRLAAFALSGCTSPNEVHIVNSVWRLDNCSVEIEPEYVFKDFTKEKTPEGMVLIIRYEKR